MLDPVAIREQSRERLRALGFPEPPAHVPIVWEQEEGYSLRPVDEIIERLVVLSVPVAACFGMPLDHGRRWIANNELQTALSPQESTLLEGHAEVDLEAIQLEVEAILGTGLGALPG